MKKRTKDRASKWLESAKSGDTFIINTIPYSKKQIEAMLGGAPQPKEQKQINTDIEEKSYGDMGKKLHQGPVEESGDGVGESTE